MYSNQRGKKILALPYLGIPFSVFFLLTWVLWSPLLDKMDVTGDSIAYLIFGFFLLFLGLGLIVNGYTNYKVGQESLSWPTIEGEIIASQLKSMPLLSSYPEIVYLYSISGETFVSNRRSVTHGGGSTRSYFKREAMKILKKYPLGSKVTVYYNPEKLERNEFTLWRIWGALDKKYLKDQNAKTGYSLLEPGYPFYSYILLVFLGLILSVIGSGIVSSFSNLSFFWFSAICVAIIIFMLLPWRDP